MSSERAWFNPLNVETVSPIPGGGCTIYMASGASYVSTDPYEAVVANLSGSLDRAFGAKRKWFR